MSRVEGAIVIDRPMEAVFDFVADERNEPLFNVRMRRAEQTTPGPVGAGTRFRTELAGTGRTTVMDVELTGYERPRRLASASHTQWMDIRGELTLDPVPGGTELRWSWELDPHGAVALLTPLAVRLGRWQEREVWGELKRLLEQGRDRSTGGVEAATPTGARPKVRAYLAAFIASSAGAGAVYLARAGDDPDLADLRRRLPFQSTAFAAAALLGAVGIPFGVVSALAWRRDPRVDAMSALAGTLLLAWLGTQRAVLERRSALQPLYACTAVPFVVAGIHGVRSRRRSQVLQARRSEAAGGPGERTGLRSGPVGRRVLGPRHRGDGR